MNRNLHERLFFKQLENTDRVNPPASLIVKMQQLAMSQLDKIFTLRQIWTFSIAFLILVFVNATIIAHHKTNTPHTSHQEQQQSANVHNYNPVNGLYNE